MLLIGVSKVVKEYKVPFLPTEVTVCFTSWLSTLKSNSIWMLSVSCAYCEHEF